MDTVSRNDSRRARQAVVAASLGNVLEWYDVILFAFLAGTITKVFYPGDSLAAQLMTWATFAVTFVVRPLGAVVIGSLADRRGRKAALSLTIALMTVGMAVIVVLPGYATLGIAAPVVLALARIVQGLSAGGEFGSATAFMSENASRGKAYYASWQVATQGMSMILAAGLSWLLTSTLDAHDMKSWGWRVAFAVGVLIGPVGWWVRTRMDDTPEFAHAHKEHSPLRALLRDHAGALVGAFLSIALATMSVYLITYLPSYATKNLHLPAWSAFPGAAVAGVVTLVGSPLVGRLADRVGTTTIMLPASVAGVVLGWPLFVLLQGHRSVATLTFVEAVVGVFMCLYFAPLPALLTQLFPVQVRSSGMTIAYSFGVAIFGGFAPFVLTWLVAATGSRTAPGMYYAGSALLSLVGVLLARRTLRRAR